MGRPIVRRAVGRLVDELDIQRQVNEAIERIRAAAAAESDGVDRLTLSGPLPAGSETGLKFPPVFLGRGANYTAPADYTDQVLMSPPATEAPFDLEMSLRSDEMVPAIGTTLPEVDDRRLWNPDPIVQPLRRVSSRPVRRLRVAQEPRASAAVPSGVEVPQKVSVLLCVRRYARRRAIMAKGHGGGDHKPPKRSATSDIRC